MIAEKSKGGTPSQPLAKRRQVPWLRLVLSLGLSGVGLWFVIRDASAADIRLAFTAVDVGYVIAGVAVIVVTMLVKAWRWQLLFHPQRPPFGALFWALSLGQLVNTAVPFLRLGELARVYDLGNETLTSKARALGTLVVEKVLDLLTLALTMFLLLPFLVIPSFVVDSGILLAAAAFAAFVALYLLAYQTGLTLRVTRALGRRLPRTLADRLLPILISGLQGLSALRSHRITLALAGSSLIIAVLSVLTPLVLFPALDLHLGLVAAAALHVVVTAGTLPPSTPAKVGVFEFLVAFMLRFFGVENSAIILAYTIIFHLVVVLPQIILGGIGAARGKKR